MTFNDFILLVLALYSRNSCMNNVGCRGDYPNQLHINNADSILCIQ